MTSSCRTTFMTPHHLCVIVMYYMKSEIYIQGNPKAEYTTRQIVTISANTPYTFGNTGC